MWEKFVLRSFMKVPSPSIGAAWREEKKISSKLQYLMQVLVIEVTNLKEREKKNAPTDRQF